MVKRALPLTAFVDLMDGSDTCIINTELMEQLALVMPADEWPRVPDAGCSGSAA